MRILALSTVLAVGGLPDAATGQQTSTDWAWKRIVMQDSLAVEYVFYSEADNRNNGVALKLVNHAGCPAVYDMTLIFRSDDRRVEQSVTGRIGPNTLLTGDAEGLFFVPFDDGTLIGEIGIRGLDVRPICHTVQQPS
ncbi:MAG: hypothetical protein RIE53_10995 [Rhodothermales bacterium]